MSVILVVAFIRYGKNFLLKVSLSTSPKELITSDLVSFNQSENSVDSEDGQADLPLNPGAEDVEILQV